MIIDTSAWIDFSLHKRGGFRTAIMRAVRAGEAMTTDPIRLELQVGLSAASETTTDQMLSACYYVPQRPWTDVQAAIDLYQRCRRAGETPRSPNDCLIAAIAIREGVPVLSRDRDFDAIARHSDLVSVRG